MGDQTPRDTSDSMDDATQVAANKAFLRRAIEEYWTSAHGLDELAQHVAPNYVHHTPFGDLDFEQFRAGATGVRAFSPVLRYAVTHIIAEGDLYAVHLRSTLTHTGTVGDIAPTGKVVECVGAYHCRMANGLIAEDWDVWNIQPVFQQLLARLQS